MTRRTADDWTITEVLGRFRNASNATLLAATGTGRLVVYKPEQGQRPLYDFDCRTLPAREVLTFEISEAAGLSSVPETRPVEGPFGPGSAQEFVDVDEEFDPAPLINGADARLWPVATLDLVINNADRKAGHVIADRSGHLWSIDHGVTLHTQPKLRTVMWGFSGLPLPDDMVAAARRLEEALDHRLHARAALLLSGREADALARRVRASWRNRYIPFPLPIAPRSLGPSGNEAAPSVSPARFRRLSYAAMAPPDVPRQNRWGFVLAALVFLAIMALLYIWPAPA